MPTKVVIDEWKSFRREHWNTIPEWALRLEEFDVDMANTVVEIAKLENEDEEMAQEDEEQRSFVHARTMITYGTSKNPLADYTTENADWHDLWNRLEAREAGRATEVVDFLATAKADSVKRPLERLDRREGMPVIDINTLEHNEMQRLAWCIVKDHHLASKSSTPSKQLLMNIEGTAGTGKSHVINAIADFLGNECTIVAPTGKAAQLVGGLTVHSALRLGNLKNMDDLRSNPLY